MSTSAASKGTSVISKANVKFTAPVPMDPLISLLATVEQLKQDISKLKAENASMAKDLKSLRQDNGLKFHPFPRFPIEIRDAIWEYALTAPQVHVLAKARSSYSQVNRIMRACKESRAKGFKLRLPFYQHTRNIKNDPLVPSYFINLLVDTIWLHKLHDIPNRLTFYDGKLSSNHNILDLNGGFECPPNLRLNSLAINIESWTSPRVKADRNIFDGTVDLLQKVHPRELLIVVAGPPVLRPSKILFIEPSNQPHQVYAMKELQFDLRGSCNWRRGRLYPDYTFTWDMAARCLEKIMCQLKEKRAKERKKLIDDGVSIEVLHCFTGDLSQWEVPKVKYVEAIEEDVQWTQAVISNNDDDDFGVIVDNDDDESESNSSDDVDESDDTTSTDE